MPGVCDPIGTTDRYSKVDIQGFAGTRLSTSQSSALNSALRESAKVSEHHWKISGNSRTAITQRRHSGDRPGEVMTGRSRCSARESWVSSGHIDAARRTPGHRVEPSTGARIRCAPRGLPWRVSRRSGRRHSGRRHSGFAHRAVRADAVIEVMTETLDSPARRPGSSMWAQMGSIGGKGTARVAQFAERHHLRIVNATMPGTKTSPERAN